MANVLNHDDSITVTAYSLHEFAFELCDLAAKGYTVSLENSKCPYGGLCGGQYHAILVPRHHYRIDLQGNHLNLPETSKESALKDDSSEVSGSSVNGVPPETKTVAKRTPTKRTT